MLETGKSYTQEIIVGPKDTALAHGSGHLEVFATPAMVGLMENTAIHCLEGMLEPDTDTVGIEIHVQHTKATAVGKKVMCKRRSSKSLAAGYVLRSKPRMKKEQ